MPIQLSLSRPTLLTTGAGGPVHRRPVLTPNRYPTMMMPLTTGARRRGSCTVAMVGRPQITTSTPQITTSTAVPRTPPPARTKLGPFEAAALALVAGCLLEVFKIWAKAYYTPKFSRRDDTKKVKVEGDLHVYHMPEKLGDGSGGGSASVAFDFIPVLGVEAPKAEEAVKYYKEVFGAVEVERSADSKRKADLEQPLLQVLLKFNSGKVLVVDRLEEELKAQPNSAFQLVCDGNLGAVIQKVRPDLAVTKIRDSPGNKQSCEFKDPFGVNWTIVGKAAATIEEPAESEANNTTSA